MQDIPLAEIYREQGTPGFHFYDFGYGCMGTSPVKDHTGTKPGTFMMGLTVMKTDSDTGEMASDSSIRYGIITVHGNRYHG